jgi:hypothetical protein
MESHMTFHLESKNPDTGKMHRIRYSLVHSHLRTSLRARS